MNSLFLQGDNLKSGGMRLQKFVCIVCCLALCACGPQKKKSMEETEVLIETSMGDIKVRLYDDTPKHRDNFIKLARAGAYDNIVFHRIVRGFMIQTGDPRLKAAGAPLAVDTAAYNYTLPAEILYPRHFHKKGALAAARMGDDVNPGKESSGTQFYIVTGKTYTPGTLMELYSAIYQNRVDERCEELSRGHLKEMYLMRRKGEAEKLQALKDSLLRQAENEVAARPPLPFNEAQKQAYTTVGGAPHLDGEYTVFGEVVEGMGVAEAIEKVRTSKERPLQEVVVRKVTVLE